jgi:hypothetical protein
MTLKPDFRSADQLSEETLERIRALALEQVALMD